MAWESLGAVWVDAGQMLSVELSTVGTTDYVIADAVLARRSCTSRLRVYDGSTVLFNGVNEVDLGFVNMAPGAPVTRTVTVENWSGVPLNLLEPISVTAGLSVAQSFGATTLLPGETTTFEIADAVWAGPSTTPEIVVHAGHQELFDEVSRVDLGFVPLLADLPVEQEFTVENTGGGQLTLVDSIQLPTGFNLVASFGDLELSPGETTTFTVAVDASTAGSLGGEVSFSHNDLGEHPFQFDIAARVGELIVDNGDPGFSVEAGRWSYNGNHLAYVDRGVHYTSAGNESKIVRWAFNGLTPGGAVEVSATWSPHANRASNAHFRVSGDGRATWVDMPTNQEVAPNDFSSVVDGKTVWWEGLGVPVTVSGDAGIWVELLSSSEGYVAARKQLRQLHGSHHAPP